METNEASAYSPNYGCVGYDDQIKVDPREAHKDMLEVSGPNSFDGVTHEPFGVLEGAFRLAYAAYTCVAEGECERPPEEQLRVGTLKGADQRAGVGETSSYLGPP